MTSLAVATPTRATGIAERVDAIDWTEIAAQLDGHGWATIERFLSTGECRVIAGFYDDDSAFRSRIVMARHGFGRGEYKYFRYPLPDIVADLRAALYPRLAPIANRWNESMRVEARYPHHLAEFLERCNDAGQTRPTPLLLRYGAGDFNALHQDLYGEHVFPLQAAVLLSDPGTDFTGGEFVLTEQRPRMQSRADVVWCGRCAPRHVFPIEQRRRNTTTTMGCSLEVSGCSTTSDQPA